MAMDIQFKYANALGNKEFWRVSINGVEGAVTGRFMNSRFSLYSDFWKEPDVWFGLDSGIKFYDTARVSLQDWDMTATAEASKEAIEAHLRENYGKLWKQPYMRPMLRQIFSMEHFESLTDQSLPNPLLDPNLPPSVLEDWIFDLRENPEARPSGVKREWVDEAEEAIANGWTEGRAAREQGVRCREKDGEFILTKGRKVLEVGFRREREAWGWIEDHMSVVDGRPSSVSLPRLSALERDGEDYRGGRSITQEEFVETFGLGEFVVTEAFDKKYLQDALNQNYDAFCDLCCVMDIPREAVGLGGKLSVHLGELMEPDSHVLGVGSKIADYNKTFGLIQLPYGNDSAPLAKSYFWAMNQWVAQDRLGENDYQRASFATEYVSYFDRKGEHPQNVSPEVMSRLSDLVKAMNYRPASKDDALKDLKEELRIAQSRLQYTNDEYVRTKAKLSGKGKALTPNEKGTMTRLTNLRIDQAEEIKKLKNSIHDIKTDAVTEYAPTSTRFWVDSSGSPDSHSAKAVTCFQAWVSDKLEEMGTASPYLVRGSESDYYANKKLKPRHASPDETMRQQVNEAMQALIDELRPELVSAIDFDASMGAGQSARMGSQVH